MHADGGSHIEEQLNLWEFFGIIKYRKMLREFNIYIYIYIYIEIMIYLYILVHALFSFYIIYLYDYSVLEICSCKEMK